jgi:predicted phosphoadenosine phosphosulfate sulfurtransferase
MGQKTRQKEHLTTNVWEEALIRMRYLYESFDKVVVSFSGGKDSTAVLNLAIEVAKEKNKLPVKAVFFDEEAIHPPTIEYVERMRKNPNVDLEWYCLEFQHRNACSNDEPFWYTWDKDKEDLWVREMPKNKNVITEHPKFKKGMSFQDFGTHLYDRKDGRVAMVTGIRTQESLRRYRIIASKKNDAYINGRSEGKTNQYRCFPIYDWSSEDVWLAVNKFGWDYNHTYDVFNKTKMYGKFLGQRVCPPYGEEPLRGLWIYAQCFPEMWHKMLDRVQGVATAWRYANTELYGSSKGKPENITYKQYTDVILDSYEENAKNDVKRTINSYIKGHQRITNMPIEDTVSHPISGLSWRALSIIAKKGDFKGRQKTGLMAHAIKRRDQLGITIEEAIKQYTR